MTTINPIPAAFYKTCVNLPEVSYSPAVRVKLDFGSCFYHAISEESASLIRDLTNQRAAMQVAVESSRHSFEEKISTVDTYLNTLWILYNSLLAQPAGNNFIYIHGQIINKLYHTFQQKSL